MATRPRETTAPDRDNLPETLGFILDALGHHRLR